MTKGNEHIHGSRGQRATPRTGRYLADPQLVEDILKNLVILDHVVFRLGIEIHLRNAPKKLSIAADYFTQRSRTNEQERIGDPLK